MTEHDRSVPGSSVWADALRIEQALAADLDRPFLVDGFTRGLVHGLALRLLESLRSSVPAEGAVCLLTDDRPVVAAAVLAALAGGPRLVLPHAATAEALRATRRSVPFSAAIGDDPTLLPKGVTLVQPGFDALRPGRVEVARAPDETLLVLHTGGSTGRPKAWAKTTRNLLGEALRHTERRGISIDDRIVATISPRHIYGLLFSTLLPLVSGASVVRETPFFPAAIASLAAQTRATILVAVPAHIRALAGTAWTANSLRLAFSSTGPLDEADAAAFTAATGRGVTEVYGSTETGGVATRCRAKGGPDWRPLEGVRWRLVQDRLHVASPYLSPDLRVDAEGFFATADRATATTDGFELLGRADGVVKVGGRRVDLGEVEERLKAVPGVREAWAWSRAVGHGRGREIVALIAGSADVELVRRALQDVLPAVAVPRRVRRVERLPWTATGKRDRAAAEKLLGD